jgi:SAM-dependent methyltransferase
MDGRTVDVVDFDDFEAAGWRRQADAYDRHLAAVTARVAEPLLDAARVAPGRRVLDLGTGPGQVAAAAAARGAEVVGVDAAPEMVALASVRHPGIRFQRADARRLPLPDASMDAVVGNFVILHVGQPEEVVAEAARALAPGGVLALSTWDAPQRCRLVGILIDALREIDLAAPAELPDGPPFFRFADDGEFSRLLRGAGLTEVRVGTLVFRHRVRTAAVLWQALIEGTVRSRALVLGQPETTRAAIRAAFERLAGAYATADGLDVPVSVTIAAGVRP